MTREGIQGYIDGYLGSGGDPAKLKDAVKAWMLAHPNYPHSESDVAVILDDLPSYRGVPK